MMIPFSCSIYDTLYDPFVLNPYNDAIVDSIYDSQLMVQICGIQKTGFLLDCIIDDFQQCTAL